MVAKAPIWRFDGPLGSIWLFGAPGVVRPSTPWLTQNILRVAYRAGRLLIESKVATPTERREAERAITEPAGSYSDDGLTSLQAEALRTLAAKAAVRRYRTIRPAALVYLLEGIASKQNGLTGQGLPEKLIEVAMAGRGIAAEGLEPPTAFNLTIGALDSSAQTKLLQDYISDPSARVALLDAIVSAWSSGDLPQLERLVCAENARWAAVGALQPLALDRNQRWAETIEQISRTKGDSLVVVGLGHIFCRGGLLDLLLKRGLAFTLEPPEPIARALAEQFAKVRT